MSKPRPWEQLNIVLSDHDTAADQVAAELRAAMARAESTGIIGQWFFVRKNGAWRLRYRTDERAGAAAAHAAVTAVLRTLHALGSVRHWVHVVYEPEVYAFGGHEGMEVSHQLFHRDSRAILAYQRAVRNGRPNQRKELTLLLCSTLMRAAGLEWYEQGDVWGRVREHRTGPVNLSPERVEETARFLRADTRPGSPILTGHLAHAAEWFDAFRTAGAELGQLAERGQLSRGLREVLSYNVLFHWNRLALPYVSQDALAAKAFTAIFGPVPVGSDKS